MKKAINFCCNASPGYADVEAQVVGAVSEALGDYPHVARRGAPDEDSINVVTVVGAAGDVLLSHSLRDRNYYGSGRGQDEPLDRFQRILVPGNWHRRRLLANPQLQLSPHAVIAVGHPRIEILRRLQAAAPQLPRDPARLRVLWAPGYALSQDPRAIPSASSNPSFLEYVEALRDYCELVLVPHPRDRGRGETSEMIDRSALTMDLVTCDVVVSDSSSVIFEAWAIGKPVIFPRWLLGDAVIKRSPGSAEAHIHSARIGYHPDSLEEMIGILRAGPVIGEDVDAFMVDYLANYRTDGSTRAIARVLTQIADPDEMARIAHLEAVLSKAVSAVPAKGAIIKPPAAARASIQLLQQLCCRGITLSSPAR